MPYRSSGQPYLMYSNSQTDYPQQMVPQIIAHYKIQLQLELQKLQHIEKSYKLKFQEIQRRIIETQRQKKTQNVDKTYDQSLERQVQNKKKQIEYLTRKLQNLRKMPFNIMNTIDQLLIPHQSPYALINAKKKQIKQLQNQLAQSENIFEGKYMIEHKLINEYETQLVLNKKLKLLREQKEVIKEKSLQISRKKVKNTMINADFKKKSQQMLKQIDELKQKIKILQSQASGGSISMEEDFVNGQQLSLASIRGFEQKRLSNKESQNYGTIQSLQIERLQMQLKQLMSQNEELAARRKQKDNQLKKLMQKNEKMAQQPTILSKTMNLIFGQQEQNQRNKDSLRQEQEIKKQDFYSRTKRKISEFNKQPETSRGKLKEESEIRLQERQVKQEQSLLQSVIKFFSRRTRASDQKQEKQKQMGVSRQENSRSIPRYSMVREQRQNQRFTDKFVSDKDKFGSLEDKFLSEDDIDYKAQESIYGKRNTNSNKIISETEQINLIKGKQAYEERQKVHEKYLAKIQNQSIIPNPKQTNKYAKFDLGSIYKKPVHFHQPTPPNKSSQEHATFDLT